MVGLPFMAILVALATTGCSESGGDGGGTPAESEAASGCAEATELQDSLTTLTQVDPASDGVDALRSAAAEVKTDLDAAVSAASSNLQSAIDQVQIAFSDFETALEGVSSEGGLGAAATQVGTALRQLGTALTDLRTEISENCSSGS